MRADVAGLVAGSGLVLLLNAAAIAAPAAKVAPSDIQTTFRRLVRDAHPDHGAASEGAGQRITELTQAKAILLAEE